MIAHYVHNLDPVIFSINDTFKLRWYGLSYLLAFLVGYLLLKRMGEKKLWVLPGNMTADFISLAAVFGVFIGGRVGNIIVYQRADFIKDPMMIFRVWEGGMASHGGILGLMIFTAVYAYKKKISWTGLGDGLVVVAPLGIMFGRLANFINGELYGRVARGTEWAMQFPLSINDDLKYQRTNDGINQIREISDKLDTPILVNNSNETYLNSQQIADLSRLDDTARESLTQFLEPRYPSQLFQAAGEGLALFLVLYITRIKFPKLHNGVLTGIFFIGYAIFRITMENYREPEIADVSIMDHMATMGQFLSFFMIFIGIGFITYAIVAKKPLTQYIPEPESK